MRIYKIFRKSEWQELESHGETAGSPDDRRDGFIHFSQKSQIGGTLAKHFKAEHDLILAACESENFGDALKWENDFPHLYRELRRDEVLWHADIPREGADHMSLGDE